MGEPPFNIMKVQFRAPYQILHRSQQIGTNVFAGDHKWSPYQNDKWQNNVWGGGLTCAGQDHSGWGRWRRTPALRQSQCGPSPAPFSVSIKYIFRLLLFRSYSTDAIHIPKHNWRQEKNIFSRFIANYNGPVQLNNINPPLKLAKFSVCPKWFEMFWNICKNNFPIFSFKRILILCF